jgi:DNA polymerase II large subunit
LRDAPLVLTTRLNPHEIDKEALNVDAAWNYSIEFYEASDKMLHSKEIEEIMGTVTSRLKENQFAALRGLGFTHGTDDISRGPSLSAYKTLETMKDKMNGQLALGHRLRAVDVSRVASTVVRSHFLPDLRGNLVAFTRQKVRCVKCGEKYRRMPLAGKCIQRRKLEIGGLSARRGEDTTECGGNVILTVSEGAVRKYVKVTEGIIQNYGVDMNQYSQLTI